MCIALFPYFCNKHNSDSMNFDIARQRPSSAFLVLFALAAATPFALADVVTPPPAPNHEGIPPLGDLILYFQWQYPLPARIAAGAMVLVTGLYLGFMTIRLKLYPIKTSLSLSLYGITVCSFLGGEDYLVGLAGSLLLALSIMNYSRSFHNEYSFERMFRASFWLGLLPLVYAPGLLLASGLLVAAMLFKRTLREVAVAIAGMFLPVFTICYINWGAGGEFFEPLATLIASFSTHTPFDFLLSLPLAQLVLLGGLILTNVFAIMLFFSNRYAVGTQPRYIIIFNICMLALTAVSLLSSAATYGVFALLAAPSAIIIPTLFIRIDKTIAFILYLIFFAIAGIFLLLQ